MGARDDPEAMSKLRTKIAAGVTILALVGLGGLAMTHPSPPPHPVAASATQQAPASGSVVKATGVEYETPDD